MARRTKAPKGTLNSILAQKLEAGESVIGLKGYVLITATNTGDEDTEAHVAIKVKVTQVSASGCTVQVMVTPESGAGEFAIGPCRWLDDIQALAKFKEEQARIKAAKQELQKFFDMKYLRNRRDELLALVETVPTNHKKDFYDDLEERKLSANKLSMSDVGSYLINILEVKYNLQPGHLELSYYWNR